MRVCDIIQISGGNCNSIIYKFSPYHVLEADVAAHSRGLVYKLNDRDFCARDRLDVDDLGQRAEGASSQTNLFR
jgi:hypothetical protein